MRVGLRWDVLQRTESTAFSSSDWTATHCPNLSICLVESLRFIQITACSRAADKGARATVRLEQAHLDVGQRFKGSLDQRPHVGPAQTAVAAAQRRDRNRADTQALNLRHQVGQGPP